MSRQKLEKFGGMLPAWDDHLLPEGQGSTAENCYLFSGALIGWRKPKLLRALVNSAARFVYRVPTVTKGTASAVLKFITNVNEGDTVKVGEETYRFTATVIAANYDVLLGATATDSATNLFAALTLGAGTGTKYSIAICSNPAISQVAGTNTQSTFNFGAGLIPVITVVAPDFGAAFNTTPVTESTSGTRIKWINTTAGNTGVLTLTGGANQSFDPTITGAATWMEFVDPDTNVMKSPVVDDKFDRYYFASPSLPPKYNTYDRIVASSPAWLLGVPPPGCPPSVSITGGGETVTVGNQSLDGTLSLPGNVIPANTMFLIPFTASATGLLAGVTAFPNSSGTPPSDLLIAYVYSDVAGEPGSEIGGSAAQQGWIAGTPISVQLAAPVAIVAGTKYWIGFATNANIELGVVSGGQDGRYISHTMSNPPPSPFGASTVGPAWQVYGNVASGAVEVARAYVYTFLTEYDEESPPSPATVVNGWSNGTWNVAMFTPPADEMGVTRNITKKRLYRSISNESGLATYFFVVELPVATDNYIDIITDDVVALNSQLASQLWFPPPEGLLGLMSMPNGMAVGFKGNELWFAEQYRPHAWPPAYVLTTEFPIVGIGVVGQSVVACTAGSPYIATGASPGAMSLTKTVAPEPCNSRRSILSTNVGVYYASPNGLILVNQSGQVSNTTELWITREKWREFTPVKATAAVLLSSSYFAFGTVDGVDTSAAQQGYTIELNADDAQSFSIWPQPGGHRLGFNKMTAPDALDIYNVQTDPWTGIGLLIQNGNVNYYDFADTAPVATTYTWRSKKFQELSKKNYEAMKVFFTTPAGTPAQSAVRNEAATDDASWNTLGAGQYGIVRVFGDGTLLTTREIRKSGELLRIISGFKVEQWEWEITGRVPISNIQVATSVRELGGV